MQSLESVIRTYVRLFPPTKKGWHTCVHQGCDHGKKGPRSAFNFSPNGGIGFNCFNCGIKVSFDPDKDIDFPNILKRVFKDFNIPDEEWKPIQLELFANRNENVREEEKKVKSIEPKSISMPKSFYLLKNAKSDDKWAKVAVAYLKSRGIDPFNYPFMMSVKMTDKWKKRLIIPVFKNKKLIFYSGRDLTGKANKKYENVYNVDKAKVIFNFDLLFEYTDKPLFIVEGKLDALSIPDCVAILGNDFSNEQIEWLNRSNRDKVYIPDSIKGKSAALKALSFGWSISTPNIGSCKDINDAVVEFGKLYVIKTIVENIHDGALGEISAELYCVS